MSKVNKTKTAAHATAQSAEVIRAASYLSTVRTANLAEIAASRGKKEAQKALRVLTDYSAETTVLAALDNATMASVASERGAVAELLTTSLAGLDTDALKALAAAGLVTKPTRKRATRDGKPTPSATPNS